MMQLSSTQFLISSKKKVSVSFRFTVNVAGIIILLGRGSSLLKNSDGALSAPDTSSSAIDYKLTLTISENSILESEEYVGFFVTTTFEKRDNPDRIELLDGVLETNLVSPCVFFFENCKPMKRLSLILGYSLSSRGLGV